MSVKLMSAVFERYNAPGNETLLALAMADHANDLGEGIYPSLKTLAFKSRQSESTVRRQIKQMLERGWLIRVNAGQGGRAVTNEYRINPEWIKGVRLAGFPDMPPEGTPETPNSLGNPQSEGSRPLENPSTAVTGNADENPSRLTPFSNANPSNLTGFPAERVSNRPQKGVTAVTPESSEPKNSDAHAPARRGARERETESGPTPAERHAAARGFWFREVVSEFLAVIAVTFPNLRRAELDALPRRLADLVRDYAAPLANQFAEQQLSGRTHISDLQRAMRIAAAQSADQACSLYRGGLVAA